jgi:glycosyltransferase involved in cell wall biosynthesis
LKYLKESIMSNYSSMSPVLVSVLINNYNYAPFLQYCLDSVFNQTYKHIEVIVYDDGSSDNSLEVLERNADKIKIIAKPNGGKYPSFNQANGIYQAFLQSKGDIICLLDSDDAFVSTKVETVVKAFIKEPQLVMVQHNMLKIDAENIPTGEIVKKNLIIDKHPLKGIYFTKRMDPFFMQTSALCFSRSFLEKMLPIPEDQFELIWADVRLTRAAVFTQRIKTLDVLLTEYRVHSSNDSNKLNDPEFFNKFRTQHYTYFNQQATLNGRPELKQISNFISKIRLGIYVLFGNHSNRERKRFFRTFITGKAVNNLQKSV